MRDKLDFVKRNIADWTQQMDAAMNARAAAIATADAELDIKILAAKNQLPARHLEYLSSSRSILRHIPFFNDARTQFRKVKLQYEAAQAAVTKLEKAKELIAQLQHEDVLRQAELVEQTNKINLLWDPLDAKLTRNENWDDTDNANYKKIENAENYIKDMCDKIVQNTQRIAQYHQMATSYDDANPERFAGHWMSIATVIVEQRDIYGFDGEIYRHDMDLLPKAQASGLEGYSTSYGGILKPGQVVRYTMAGTKILLEQDHEGKVRDKTPLNASPQHKELAAIKTAHLLLLDRSMHPNKKIFLKGGPEYLPQARLVAAALLVQAKQAGIVLKLEDLAVDVPGWKNWRSSTVETRDAIKQDAVKIEATLARHRAQNELKDKIQAVKGKKIMVDEPTHPPRKHS